jgi:hypothetical protein
LLETGSQSGCNRLSGAVWVSSPLLGVRPGARFLVLLAILSAGGLFAQQPILYHHGTLNTADSAGNKGALLKLDAVGRPVISTLLLKSAPTALLMAPDGLTAYLLDNAGGITYYDVLGGTADLSVSTYTPGQAGGYPGSSSWVFAHPDGTRLFWNVGGQLAVFNLTTRKVTNLFDSSLPTTSAMSMQMSQDGSTMWFCNAAGNVAVLDTLYGSVLTLFTTTAGSTIYPSPSFRAFQRPTICRIPLSGPVQAWTPS